MGSPKRIWTDRTEAGCVKSLEINDDGIVSYREETASYGAAFFVDRDFIADCFASTGRAFDAAKLPSNFVPFPKNF